MSSKIRSLLFVLPLSSFLLALASPAQPSGRPIDITADSLEYMADQNLMVGRGNVVVKEGDMQLSADYMSVQTVTRDVHAKGNVLFQRGAETWKGSEFRYNLDTMQGDFGEFKAFYDPFYVTAKESKRLGKDSYQLKGLTLTTCDGDDPAVSIRANEASIEGNRVKANGATVYLADLIPVLYMPYYTRSLDTHERFFQFLPGYNSRLGAFLLTAYNYPIYGNVRGITHLDYRTKRGFGIGQDFTWRDREEETYEGIIQGYYLKDDEPLEGPESDQREGVVEEERYRLRLAHVQRFSERDSLFAELNYLSDPYVLDDFFRSEFRQQVQPENRITLSHRDDSYLAALQLNKRLNDFYDNVDRLPELTLDVPRMNLFETDLYYESENSASYLERVFPDGSEAEDYDAFRFDTGHYLYYPLRTAGFLNLIPRAGYRGTYYSTTLDQSIVTNSVVVEPDEGAAYVTNRVLTLVEEKDGELRNIPQLGMEGSFKAFKAWNDLIILGDGDGVRHVAEPYFDYTLSADPNLQPDELPQFDEVDQIEESHNIKLGFRNKLQTRRNNTPADIIDLDLYTYYRIEKEDEEEDFSPLYLDGDLSLHKNLWIEFDGTYDFYESDVLTFNTRLILDVTDGTRLEFENRYRMDSQNLLSAELDLFPEERWAFTLGARYDAENSELEEQYYMIKRNGKCVGWGLGVRQIIEDDSADDELEVWLMVWLTAFPDSLISFDY